MTVFTEGALQITFPSDTVPKKFDDDAEHGLSHCMKAVDFVVELPDRVWFVEFKDPDHPSAKSRDQAKFIERFSSGELDKELRYKYRDSFLYRWASEEFDKPIHYFVLVAIDSLSDADLLIRTDNLKRLLPVKGQTPRGWKRQIAEGCCVFNIQTWNKTFPDCPVVRKR